MIWVYFWGGSSKKLDEKGFCYRTLFIHKKPFSSTFLVQQQTLFIDKKPCRAKTLCIDFSRKQKTLLNQHFIIPPCTFIRIFFRERHVSGCTSTCIRQPFCIDTFFIAFPSGCMFPEGPKIGKQNFAKRTHSSEPNNEETFFS